MKLTTLREAAQQALEALELAQTDVHWELHSPTRKFLRKAEKSLRAALAEEALDRMSEDERRLGIQMQPVLEPVAWMDIDPDGQRLSVRMWSDGNHEEVPLYTAPPQRKPLTDEEIDASWKKYWWGFVSFEEARVIARAIERAHGIE